MQKKTSSPGSQIVIKGEGRDEWKNRYFKFAVRGTESNIPPFSVDEIIKNPNSLFVELGNAGASAFSRLARKTLLNQLDQRKPTGGDPVGLEQWRFCPPRPNFWAASEAAGALVPAPWPATAG